MSIELEECCPNRILVWRPTRVGDRWADMYLCTSCGHIHRMESWLVPIRYPKPGRCVNCAGLVSRSNFQVAILRPGDSLDGPEPKCGTCGFTPGDDRALHERLAALHPDGNFLLAAVSASDAGRHVLSLKLASAELRWGTDIDMSRAARLQALQEMGLDTEALNEAWDWTIENPPSALWPMLAEMEAQRGNVEGALSALEKGLEHDSESLELWADYGELLAHLDNRPHALEAAVYALTEPNVVERALIVITEMAQRYYDEGLYVEAIQACGLAGDYQVQYVNLAWLRAQLAATENLPEPAVEWLEVVLQLEPDHEAALDALEKLRPSKKKGWFGWSKD